MLWKQVFKALDRLVPTTRKVRSMVGAERKAEAKRALPILLVAAVSLPLFWAFYGYDGDIFGRAQVAAFVLLLVAIFRELMVLVGFGD